MTRKTKGPDLRRTRAALQEYLRKQAAGELVIARCRMCDRPVSGIGGGGPLWTNPDDPVRPTCTDCMREQRSAP